MVDKIGTAIEETWMCSFMSSMHTLFDNGLMLFVTEWAVKMIFLFEDNKVA